jgi:hypothetical protein
MTSNKRTEENKWNDLKHYLESAALLRLLVHVVENFKV